MKRGARKVRTRRRVLHIINSATASGAEVTLASAAAVWEDEGIECHVVEKGPHGPYAPVLADAGYRVHTLRDDNALVMLHDLRHLIANGHYDVVHIHTEHANFWLALVAISAGAKAVRTVHGLYPFRGALKSERRIQRRMLHWLGVPAVAVSGVVAVYEERMFGIRPTVIENWVATELRPATKGERTRARADLGLPSAATVVLTVGNCAPVKRHDMALSAIVQREDLIYVHIGSEEPGKPERALASDTGVLHRTRFIGSVVDVRPYLHSADLFLMPSSRESSGVALIEALCAGIPCVISRIPALLETASGGSSMSFEGQDELSEILRSATTEEITAWRRDSERDSINFRKRFHPSRGVSQYARVYRGLFGCRTSHDTC